MKTGPQVMDVRPFQLASGTALHTAEVSRSGVFHREARLDTMDTVHSSIRRPHRAEVIDKADGQTPFEPFLRRITKLRGERGPPHAEGLGIIRPRSRPKEIPRR